MKIKLTGKLREKVSSLKSRVQEPEHFERWRTYLYGWTVFVCLIWLPVKFIFFMGAGFKWTFFLSGMIMMSFFLLTSMIQPGSKSFWLLFLNILITLPILVIFFPFDYFLRNFEFLEALFGLLPLWIPICYMVFLTWKNIKLKKKHKEEFLERVEESKEKNIKIIQSDRKTL